eukprot:2127464-Rhodomonas_salina.1
MSQRREAQRLLLHRSSFAVSGQLLAQSRIASKNTAADCNRYLQRPRQKIKLRSLKLLLRLCQGQIDLTAGSEPACSSTDSCSELCRIKVHHTRQPAFGMEQATTDPSLCHFLRQEDRRTEACGSSEEKK